MLALAACFRDAPESADITEAERAAFVIPADSSLTTGQVEHYLRTTSLQLALLEAELPGALVSLAEADSTRRRASDGERSRLPTRTRVWGDLVDRALVRTARRLGHNPAEIAYVRERIAWVGSQLRSRQALATSGQSAELMRQQVELLRGQPGVSQAQMDAMLQAAERSEALEQQPPPRAFLQNMETLRRARPGLDETDWARIAAAAEGVGLSTLGDLPPDEAENALGELRRMHEATVENRPPGP